MLARTIGRRNVMGDKIGVLAHSGKIAACSATETFRAAIAKPGARVHRAFMHAHRGSSWAAGGRRDLTSQLSSGTVPAILTSGCGAAPSERINVD
jgi:hypothetical protein